MKESFYPDRDSIRDFCIRAETLFRDWNIASADAMDMVISFEEALTNIFEHGFCQKSGEHCIVSVEIFKSHHSIYIIITDCGVSFSFDNITMPERATYLDSNRIGGFGIGLIRNLMNHVAQFRLNDENVMILTKKVSGVVPGYGGIAENYHGCLQE